MSDELLDRLVAWAGESPEIRAVILTSTRARPEGPPDELSDYDVILAVTEPKRFAEGDLGWHAALGTPLVRWGDEDELLGHHTFFRGVVYDDLAKVDFTIWPDALLDAIRGQERLPAGLDYGYRVLRDTDDRTAGWPAPTFSAYVLAPPTAAEYRAMVEEFWWGTTYLAKAVRRGELFFAASFMLEHDLKLIALRRMLEWRIAAASGWAHAPGAYGRGLEGHLDDAARRALRATYAGLDADAIWGALFGLIDLFGRTARDVAAALGYRYPDEIEARMTAHLHAAREARPAPAAFTEEEDGGLREER
jgi:aminoglycoside 6-adenylyltransferase